MIESFNLMVDNILTINNALRQKSDALQVTLDHMAEGITLVDKDCNLVLFNQRFVELFKLRPELLEIPVSLKNILYVQACNG